jgi:hypothetical protein
MSHLLEELRLWNRLPRYTIIPTSLTACHHEVHATQLCDRPAAHANRMADACSQKARHQTRAENSFDCGTLVRKQVNHWLLPG